MKKIMLFLMSFCFVQSVHAQSCDRDCLRSHMTHYLDALLKHDPDLLPLADDLRYTEDHIELQPGEGLWVNIEGYGTFRQDIIDVRNSTVGSHVLAMENGKPVLVAIRLKIIGGMEEGIISEIESTVVRTPEEGMIFRPEAVVEASVAMTLTPAQALRNTREEMIQLALLYPAGLRIGSFVDAGLKASPDAYRFENGQLMAGPGCTFFPGCTNLREQGLPTLAGITAQVAGVDEEQGIVWLRMNFGPGSLMRGEGELSVWEMFKIYDGQIQAVEAFMEEVPANTPFGWEY